MVDVGHELRERTMFRVRRTEKKKYVMCASRVGLCACSTLRAVCALSTTRDGRMVGVGDSELRETSVSRGDYRTWVVRVVMHGWCVG